jgi:hypothetical protein
MGKVRTKYVPTEAKLLSWLKDSAFHDNTQAYPQFATIYQDQSILFSGDGYKLHYMPADLLPAIDVPFHVTPWAESTEKARESIAKIIKDFTFTSTVTVDTAELRQAVMQAQVFARETGNTVLLRITSDTIKVRAQSVETGSIIINVSCQYDGVDMDLVVNGKQILSALAVLVSPGKSSVKYAWEVVSPVTIEMTDPHKVFRIGSRDMGLYAIMTPKILDPDIAAKYWE